MLHNDYPILADNGIQYFMSCDVEKILSDYFQKDSNGQRFYEVFEILDNYKISKSELDRMLYRLSYEYCYDENGNYKW